MKKALMTAHVAYAIAMFNLPNIKLLLEDGYEVHVACNFDDRSSLSDEKVQQLQEELDRLGVKYFHIPFSRSPVNRGNIRAFRELKNLISRENYDLIHCHTPVGGILTRLAAAGARRKGTRVIYTAHGFHFYRGAPAVNWILYFTAEWLCSFFTDTLITINREDYRLAQRKMHAGEVCYVPGVGVDTQKFASHVGDRAALRREFSVGEEDILCLSVGELSDRKNQKVLLEALASLPESKVHLVLVGVGENQETYERMIERLKLKDRVHLALFRGDIPELCHSADIFLFPSRQEGLPVALMEAMACGLPVICSAIRGNIDLINEKGGLLCPADDAAAFARAIEKLSSDQALRREMGRVNREKIKAYDIQVIEKHMKEIYGISEKREKDE